jgi:serine/threonine protein kinase
MERADGSLNDLHYIYREDYKTHVPPAVLLNLMEQSATALDFLASQKISTASFTKMGLQHCDVKPSNILLMGEQVKVADFGLSGPLKLADTRNVALGTPPYAAPELYEGRPNERTDQYGLAVAYCELRAGRFPFSLRPDGSVADTTPDLTMLPEKERPVLARALFRQWLDRYHSCTAFIEALKQVVDSTTIPIEAQKARSSSKKIVPAQG